MVYSFLNVTCFMIGPGLAVNLGAGAGVAEEGIDIEPAGEKNKMDIGSDGTGQHTLLADDSATAKIRLLKTSPYNAVLQAAYDFQSASSAVWGQIACTVTDTGRGDVTVLQVGAFHNKPKLVYAKEGPMLEWNFDFVKHTTVLGVGQ
jgi:Protein of unknown function (DUF3277)